MTRVVCLAGATALVAAALLPSSSAAAAASRSSAPPKLLVELHTAKAWLGSSAVSLQGERDPVAMMSSWVYPPTELLAFRPAVNESAPAWVEDTTKDLKYQTLYVASAKGRTSALPAGSVDSLAFWNRKPDGIIGECSLFGFDSAAAPDISFGPARKGSWHANLTSDCSNINGAVPWPRFALSADGATAAAWTQDAKGDITVYCLDGQTGALRWNVSVPCGTPAQCDFFLSYGVDVSDDGRWVVFDDGIIGGGPHRINVLAAADGKPRCKPVPSPDPVSAHISPDGDFLYTSEDAANPSTGFFATWRWNASAAAYSRVGEGKPPVASGAHGWTSAEYAFSLDPASGATLLGVVWFDTTLQGDSLLAVYDAADPAAGPRSSFVMQGLTNGFANAGAVVDCAGALCAAGFWTQRVGGPQNTLVALSGADPAFRFNFTTPGSVDAVSLRHDAAADVYYLLGVGCQSLGVCTKPGGDAYLFELSP